MGDQTLYRSILRRWSASRTVRTLATEARGRKLTLLLGEETPGHETARLMRAGALASSDPSAFRSAIASLLVAGKEGAAPDSDPAVDRWLVLVPRHLTLLRFLTLPEAPLDELRTMARLQALPGLPFPEDELVCDIVRQEPGPEPGTRRVLLVILRQSGLSPWLELGEATGRWPDGFVPAALALRRGSPSSPAATADRLHIDFTEDWAGIDLWKGETLVASRALPSRRPTEETSRLVAECRQTLQLVPPAKPAHISLSGLTGADREPVAESLRAAFGLPTNWLEPRPLPGEQAVSLHLQGTVLSLPEDRVQLLPAEIDERRRRHHRRREWARTGIWLALWLGALLLVGAVKAGTRLLSLYRLNQQIWSLEGDTTAASGLAEQTAALRDQAQRQSTPLDLLRDVHALAPASLQIRLLAYQTDGTVSLQGRADQLSTVMGFVNALQNSPILEGAALQGSTRHGRGSERIEFQIVARLRLPPTETGYE